MTEFSNENCVYPVKVKFVLFNNLIIFSSFLEGGGGGNGVTKGIKTFLIDILLNGPHAVL